MGLIQTIIEGFQHDVMTFSTLMPLRRRGNNVVTDSAQPQPIWSQLPVSGVYVDESAAMTLTAVYRAVSLIASTIAALPQHVYRTNQFGEQNLEESPLTAFLWNRPNPEMTRLSFWETVIAHEVLNGDAFLFVVKTADGRPLELWPLEPWRVQVGRTEGRKVYLVDGKVGMIDFMAGGEIVHVPNMSRDGLRGMSPIRLASMSLSLGKAAETYAAAFFATDATPPAVLSTDKELTADQAKNTADLWMQQHQGIGNRNIAVIGNGLKFQAIAINPEDAQLLEERKFQIQEVARIFGVPPNLLADLDHASQGGGNGLEEQGYNYLRFTLLRHIEAFEQAIDDALLNRIETGRKMKFVVDGLLRAGTQARWQAWATAHGRILTANEIRKIEGFPPIEGGDVLLQMTNLAPAELLAEETSLTPPTPPAPKPAPKPAPTGAG